MSERIQKLLEGLATARANLFTAFDQVGERGDEQLYSDGAGWTVRQLATHLMITDRGVANVIRQIAEGGNPIPADYDVNRYNQRSVEKQPDVSIEQAKSAMTATREEFIAWLQALPDEKLDLVARHPLLFDAPLWRFIEIKAIHEQNHADDIQAHLRKS
jgi:hypothetical protein